MTGEIISYEEYSPYGSTSYQATAASIKAAAKRYRYTGKERDEESGLALPRGEVLRAVAWEGGAVPIPASLVDGPNVYRYVRGNPIVGTDPNGMATSDDATPQAIRSGNTLKPRSRSRKPMASRCPLRGLP